MNLPSAFPTGCGAAPIGAQLLALGYGLPRRLRRFGLDDLRLLGEWHPLLLQVQDVAGDLVGVP